MKKNNSKISEAICEYLKEKDFAIVAQKYNIHPTTLRRWVKNFLSGEFLYKRPWKRVSEKIEEIIVMLKEQKPGITLIQAKMMLKKRGIDVSIKVIYNIWKAYGFIKQSIKQPFSFFIAQTPEHEYNLALARLILKREPSQNGLKKVAQLLAHLPSLPLEYADLIEQIPESLLSPKRRLDKLYLQFLKIPIIEFYKRIHDLRLQMEKKELFYSSLKAGLLELAALIRMRLPNKMLKLIAHLRKIKGKLRDPSFEFQLGFFEASALCELLQIEEATIIAKKLLRILIKRHSPYYYHHLGQLMTFMSNYRAAMKYFIKALEQITEEEQKKILYYYVSLCLALGGEYSESLRYINMAKIDFNDKYYAHYSVVRAIINLGMGKIEQSLLHCRESLEQIEKKQIISTIYPTISCYAAIYCATGYREKGINLLRDYIKILAKYGQEREVEILKNFIEPNIFITKQPKLPTLHLINLIKKAKENLKIKDYRKLCDYARKYGLTGFLHRCLMFFPEVVLNVLNHGKNPELPVALLRFPIFNPDTPNYQMKFLGKTVIYKNEKRLRIKLTPVESAFLIFLGFKIGEPEKTIFVDETLNNFWHRVNKPERRLSQILANLKSKLMMPRHLLVTHSGLLINKGFYITTDYTDYCSIITRAKALQRAGEWEFARKEYLQAFKLFRGEPFKKNFDNWSVDMRFRILSQFETEAINFAKSCMEHNNKNDTRRILQKVLKIIPDSEEAKRLLNGL